MFCTDPFTHANFDAKFVALCFSVIFWRDFSPRYYTGFRLVQNFVHLNDDLKSRQILHSN